MARHPAEVWEVGEYTFTKWSDGLYSFHIDGDDDYVYERFYTLDKAMVAAVGQKHTGRRGAGGTAVGTAADWFARMIGLEVADNG